MSTRTRFDCFVKHFFCLLGQIQKPWLGPSSPGKPAELKLGGGGGAVNELPGVAAVKSQKRSAGLLSFQTGIILTHTLVFRN